MVTISADWFGWFGYLRFFGAHWGYCFYFIIRFYFGWHLSFMFVFFLSLFLLSLVFLWMHELDAEWRGGAGIFFIFYFSIFFISSFSPKTC